MKYLIGIDEAGRGPLAGPVAIGVFMCGENFDMKLLAGVRDSKKLSEIQREKWFEKLKVLAVQVFISKRCNEHSPNLKRPPALFYTNSFFDSSGTLLYHLSTIVSKIGYSLYEREGCDSIPNLPGFF